MIFRRGRSEVVGEEAEHMQKSGPKLKVDGLTEGEQKSVDVYIQAKNLNIENKDHQQLIIKYIKFLRSHGGDGGGHADGGRGRRRRAEAEYGDNDGGGRGRRESRTELPPEITSMMENYQEKHEVDLFVAWDDLKHDQRFGRQQDLFKTYILNERFRSAVEVLARVGVIREAWLKLAHAEQQDEDVVIMVRGGRDQTLMLPAVLYDVESDGVFTFSLIDTKTDKVYSKINLGRDILDTLWPEDMDEED